MSRYIDLDKSISIAIQSVVDVLGHGITVEMPTPPKIFV